MIQVNDLHAPKGAMHHGLPQPNLSFDPLANKAWLVHVQTANRSAPAI
jgi:hypothetical protein